MKFIHPLVSLVSLFPLLVAQTPLGLTHGPILGRPGSDHMGVWARISSPAQFRVRYGASPQSMDTFSPYAHTSTGRDNTGWVLLEGLRPNTKYFYQVIPQGKETAAATPDGSFTTLPDPAGFRNDSHNPQGLFNFSFEYACGNSQPGIDASLPVYRTMLERIADQIQFAILNGDWIYEKGRRLTVDSWREENQIPPPATPSLVNLISNIVGVWENYKIYLEDGEPLAAWHRNVPSFFTFDDHEIVNDVYGTATAGRRDRKAVFRDIAVQAWYDYLGWSNPVLFRQPIHFGHARFQAGSDILTDPDADFESLNLDEAANLHVHWDGILAGIPDYWEGDPGPGNPNAGVYDIAGKIDRHRLRIHPPARADGDASYSVGRLSYFDFRIANAHMFFLDTRTSRDMHEPDQPDKPGLSMLGQRQKKWLLDGMAKSDAEFFFVVSSVNFMVPHIPGTRLVQSGETFDEKKDDAWTVFVDEREQLIRYWDSLGKPVMVLTGDLHNSFAIRITDRVWEFASGPHNSGNHRASDEAYRPPNGVFESINRDCDILWSTYFLDDTPGKFRKQPVYTVVQVNNVFNSPGSDGEQRWVAFPRPHVVIQFHDGFTGKLLYAQPVFAAN